ncbi:hypothetical protein [Hymenobacter rigui]|uniref:hypothetical protein n=1 Tax=Hymenobacter rigui TaxID=334424 RepID=UPI001F0C5EDF|nr:hypothetical protein [Hymenobacter rigui]
MGFEVVGGKITKGGVASFGIVVGGVVANFELGFGQAGEAAAIEPSSSSALKRLQTDSVWALS